MNKFTSCDVTQDDLKNILNYDKSTGIFTWKVSSRNHPQRVGTVAGTMNNRGYNLISINGKQISAHRIAFLYVTGKIPKYIDHINHNRFDNRWCNLRKVSHQENHRNTKISKNNKSGHNGVMFNKRLKKWTPYICVDGKQIHLGTHKDIDIAITIRKAAEGWYGFHKNHGVNL